MGLPDLDQLEERFFKDGPRFCLQGSLALLGAGLALSTLGAVFASDGDWTNHFGFAGLMAIPSVLLLLLSFALKRRHVATIPLVLGICVFVARYFIVSPNKALEGIEVSDIQLLLGWLVVAAELLVVCFAVWFMWHLWSKGAFRKP